MKRDRREEQKMFYHGSRIKLHRFCAHVAQSVEHILGKDEVTGSIPVMGLRKIIKGYLLSVIKNNCPDTDNQTRRENG